MTETARIEIQGKTVELPLVVGSENEVGIDIGKFRAQTGAITLDPGYVNTGACTSAVTFLNGEQGILRYRGYPIEQLAAKSNFIEVAYLLIYGELPTATQLEDFAQNITRHTMLHEDLRHIYEAFPKDAHPMAILSCIVCALSTFYPEFSATDHDSVDRAIVRLLGKIPTIAAWAFKKSIGQPLVYPENRFSYCENFLNMMYSVPATGYEMPKEFVEALNVLFILHADHEQNCSTTTARVVGSAHADPYVTVAAAAGALYGPRHGGANEAVLHMLEEIAEFDNVGDFIAGVKTGERKLMGFGHRVYKNYDPRARIVKDTAHRVFDITGTNPLLDIALKLEEAALADPYFVDRRLYPNVDFYSGLIYQSMGFPVEMFTVLFTIGRTPGWLAHWEEMLSQDSRIARPRQRYTGPADRDVPSIDVR